MLPIKRPPGSSLAMFDSQLRSAICCITNSNLSEVQWPRASLPVGDDDLVIKMAVEFITALKLTETVVPFCVQNMQLNGKQYHPECTKAHHFDIRNPTF